MKHIKILSLCLLILCTNAIANKFSEEISELTTYYKRYTNLIDGSLSNQEGVTEVRKFVKFLHRLKELERNYLIIKEDNKHSLSQDYIDFKHALEKISIVLLEHKGLFTLGLEDAAYSMLNDEIQKTIDRYKLYEKDNIYSESLDGITLLEKLIRLEKESNKYSNKERILRKEELKSILDKKTNLAEKNLHHIWFGNLEDKQTDYYKYWIKVADNSGFIPTIWTDKDRLLCREVQKLILKKVKYDFFEKGVDLRSAIKNKYEISETVKREIIGEIIRYQNIIYRNVIDYTKGNLGSTYDDAVTTNSVVDILKISHSNDIVSFLSDKRIEFKSSFEDAHIISYVKDIKDIFSGNNDLYNHYVTEMELRGQFAVASDISRLLVLFKEGGIYVDFDILPENTDISLSLDHYGDQYNNDYVDEMVSKTGILLSQDSYDTNMIDTITYSDRRVFPDLINIKTHGSNFYVNSVLISKNGSKTLSKALDEIKYTYDNELILYKEIDISSGLSGSNLYNEMFSGTNVDAYFYRINPLLGHFQQTINTTGTSVINFKSMDTLRDLYLDRSIRRTRSTGNPFFILGSSFASNLTPEERLSSIDIPAVHLSIIEEAYGIKIDENTYDNIIQKNNDIREIVSSAVLDREINTTRFLSQVLTVKQKRFISDFILARVRNIKTNLNDFFIRLNMSDFRERRVLLDDINELLLKSKNSMSVTSSSICLPRGLKKRSASIKSLPVCKLSEESEEDYKLYDLKRLAEIKKINQHEKDIESIKSLFESQFSDYEGQIYQLEPIGQGETVGSLDVILSIGETFEHKEVNGINKEIVDRIIQFNSDYKNIHDQVLYTYLTENIGQQRSYFNMTHFWLAYATYGYAKNGFRSDFRSVINTVMYASQLAGTAYDLLKSSNKKIANTLNNFEISHGKLIRKAGRGLSRVNAGVMVYNLVDDFIHYPSEGTPDQKFFWSLNTATDVTFTAESVVGVAADVATKLGLETLSVLATGAAEVLGPVGFGLFAITELITESVEYAHFHKKLDDSDQLIIKLKEAYNEDSCKMQDINAHEIINCTGLMPIGSITFNQDEFNSTRGNLKLGNTIKGPMPRASKEVSSSINLLEMFGEFGVRKSIRARLNTSNTVILPTISDGHIDYSYVEEGSRFFLDILDDLDIFGPGRTKSETGQFLDSMELLTRGNAGKYNLFCSQITSQLFSTDKCNAYISQGHIDPSDGNLKYAYGMRYLYSDKQEIAVNLNDSQEHSLITPIFPNMNILSGGMIYESVGPFTHYVIRSGSDRLGSLTNILVRPEATYEIHPVSSDEFYNLDFTFKYDTKYVDPIAQYMISDFEIYDNSGNHCIKVKARYEESNVCFMESILPKVSLKFRIDNNTLGFFTADLSNKEIILDKMEILSDTIDLSKSDIDKIINDSNYIVHLETNRTNPITVIVNSNERVIYQNNCSSEVINIKLESGIKYRLLERGCSDQTLLLIGDDKSSIDNVELKTKYNSGEVLFIHSLMPNLIFNRL